MDIWETKVLVPTEKLIDLVEMTAQEAFYNGVLNPMVLEILFDVNLFLVMTDNDITDEEKQDKFKLFDELKSNGYIFTLKKELKEMEDGDLVESLWQATLAYAYSYDDYQKSAAGVLNGIESFIGRIAELVEENAELIKSVNLKDLANVIPIARDLGYDFEQVGNIPKE